MSAARLEEAIDAIGPVMAQLFGQSEAPMMISTLAPTEHFQADGTIAVERLSSAGPPTPLITVGDHGRDGALLAAGRARRDRRARLAGDGRLLQEPGGHGRGVRSWVAPHRRHRLPRRRRLPVHRRPRQGHDHHRRLQRLLRRGRAGLWPHPAVQDCAVIGLPDEKWGERVTAVVQPLPAAPLPPTRCSAYVKERLGSVKAPKQVEVWPDLPRSKVGKILKTDVKAQLRAAPCRTIIVDRYPPSSGG